MKKSCIFYCCMPCSNISIRSSLLCVQIFYILSKFLSLVFLVIVQKSFNSSTMVMDLLFSSFSSFLYFIYFATKLLLYLYLELLYFPCGLTLYHYEMCLFKAVVLVEMKSFCYKYSCTSFLLVSISSFTVSPLTFVSLFKVCLL